MEILRDVYFVFISGLVTVSGTLENNRIPTSYTLIKHS